MSLNARKSVCMVFSPYNLSKVVMSCFPELDASGEKLQYVNSFKYLGHIISSNNIDDSDIQREMTNMFIRTYILTRKFNKCTVAVKTVLFRSYFVYMMLPCGLTFMWVCWIGFAHATITHSLVDHRRWRLATADDHSIFFLLHWSLSCDISFSWM